MRFIILQYIIIFPEDSADRKRDEYFLTGGGIERSCVASKCIIYFLVCLMRLLFGRYFSHHREKIL